MLPRVASCDLPVVLSDRFAATGGDVENRWILVRNDVGGQIRFYITAAFERDICTYANVKQAFLDQIRKQILMKKIQESFQEKCE